MRLVTANRNNRSFVGVVDEQITYVVDLQNAERAMSGATDIPSSLIDCILQGETFVGKVRIIEDWALNHRDKAYYYQPEDVKLLAPIPRPLKNVLCVGKNYAEHAIEMGSPADIPEHIMMFTKAPTTVIGHNEIILHHEEITNQLDYEGELAVVIGKMGRGITKEEALDYVFGYTIINDITARDIQSRHKQFYLGKSLDASCPMGPFVAHKSIMPNPNFLNLVTKVNGETRQSGNTEQFIFNIETIISTISQGMTIEPGDIIATGTPAGVGKGFKPPKFLRKGDVVEISIDGLGTLRNTIQK